MQNSKKILILGASGLVGSHLLNKALQDESISEVFVLVRNPLQKDHPKLIQVITDFKDLDQLPPTIDVLYCCIGTTRKKTPDLTEYKAIDYGITMKVAEYYRALDTNQIHLISSVGASSDSSNFYLRIKGEIEEGIKSLGFPSCLIYRPSMLIGKRNESRPFERIGQILCPIFDFFTFNGKYHSVLASELAQSMLENSRDSKSGTVILHYPDFKTNLSAVN